MIKSPANRGKALESLIDYTNMQYRVRREAIINKVPTPFKVVRQGKRIISAFPDPDHPKHVDYEGHFGGKPVAFDAKGTESETSFRLSNIKEHQMRFLNDWQEGGGVSFFLIEFTKHRKIYCVPFEEVRKRWEIAEQGGRKSIPYRDFRLEWEAGPGRGMPLDYLYTVKAVML